MAKSGCCADLALRCAWLTSQTLHRGEQGSSTAHAWSGAVPCFGATSGVLSLSPWMRGGGAAVDSPSLRFLGALSRQAVEL